MDEGLAAGAGRELALYNSPSRLEGCPTKRQSQKNHQGRHKLIKTHSLFSNNFMAWISSSASEHSLLGIKNAGGQQIKHKSPYKSVNPHENDKLKEGIFPIIGLIVEKSTN